MFKIGQLLRFISDLDPRASHARLAFFNFLKAFYKANDEWTIEVVRHFASHALSHVHWRENQDQLAIEVRKLCETFAKQFGLEVNSEQLNDSLSLQVITLDHFADLCDIVYQYHTRQSDNEFRMIALSDSELLTIRLDENQQITTSHFDSLCTVRNGNIEPLRLDFQVNYTEELELSPRKEHLLNLSPHLISRIQKQNGLWLGIYLRGYTFQAAGEFKVQSLEEQPPIFYPLKRLEQHFVDRSSDPFYVECIQSLERAMAQAQAGSADPKRFESTLQRADALVEQVYTEDKYMKLLVKELRQALQQSSSQLKLKANYSSANRPRDIEL